MNDYRQRILILFIAAIAAHFCSIPHAYGQTLKEKLEQQTKFHPQSSSPVEQLVEVALEFQIPMAIEWLEQPNGRSSSAPAFGGGSVLHLIEQIVQQSPNHQLAVGDHSLHVFSPLAVSHPLNFLNLRIPRFVVRDESLLGAQAWLRTMINMMLYPELYKDGFGGGHGGAADSPFWIRGITISVENLTIREILTKIAEANGNALWVVELSPDELAGGKPRWDGVPRDEYGHSPLNNRWRFITLIRERPNNGMQRTRN
jgi:hypothetical protein